MTFGDHLKDFIESKGFTTEEYMDKFEMSYYTMHKYFSNKSLPGYKFLYRLKKMGFNLTKVFTNEVYDRTLYEWEKANGKLDPEHNYKTEFSEYSQVADKKVSYSANKKKLK